jgi:N-methylhydantoinase A
MGLRLGIDIGGTFTDLVLVDEVGGSARLLKTPSTPDHPSQAVTNGIRELVGSFGVDPSEIDYFVHGTTLALNTVIQRSGARTGLLVTDGFADILELQRLRLPDPHHFNADRPQSLVSRQHVREVDERLLADGTIHRPLDEDAVVVAATELVGLGVEAIAICFLHAYRNPGHEIAAQAAVERAHPGLYVCRSSDVWPQQREYERSLVTVINAYVGKRMRHYFASLEEELVDLGVPARVLSTKSNGGVMTARGAGKAPVQTLLSGPASGVIGARHVGNEAGFDRLLTFDMGGTSADIAVIAGAIAVSTTSKIGDFPVIIPAVDVSSIGAGGGSIVWTDSFGVLKVGPQSAGASPGPACYARGGERPTVTDAYLAAGILDPDRFLGGTMPLDTGAATRALAGVAEALKCDIRDAGSSILQVATSNMYAEFVPALAQHGVDPSDYALVPYGGAGPTHAFMLADEIGLRHVVVPPSPGTLCALGCLVADLRADFVRTVLADCGEIVPEAVDDAFAAVQRDALVWLDEQGVSTDEAQLQRSADMRYAGQSFELAVDLPPGRLTGAHLAQLFHTRYEAVYGYSDPDTRVEVVNVRGSVVGHVIKPQSARIAAQQGRPVPRESRLVRLGVGDLLVDVYDRVDLGAGARFDGPAIVEQYDTTTFVTPGWSLHVDQYGSLVAEKVTDAS